jgi:hypothetical protein
MVLVVIRQKGVWRVWSHDHKLLLNLNIFKFVRGENVSGDIVARSLALKTRQRSVGMQCTRNGLRKLSTYNCLVSPTWNVRSKEGSVIPSSKLEYKLNRYH